MAIGFQSGIFGRRTMRNPYETPGIGDNQSMNMPVGEMPIGVAQISQPAKRGIFGKGGKAWDVLGAFGDAFSGNEPIYAMAKQAEQNRLFEAQKAQAQRMQEREDFLFREDYKRANAAPDEPKDQLTRYMLAAGIDPNSEEARGMYRAAAQNAAYPVQGVPFTDAQGNSGIQFIRPGQMQGAPDVPTAPVGKLRPIGGSGGNVTGGFRR